MPDERIEMAGGVPVVVDRPSRAELQRDADEMRAAAKAERARRTRRAPDGFLWVYLGEWEDRPAWLR